MYTVTSFMIHSVEAFQQQYIH